MVPVALLAITFVAQVLIAAAERPPPADSGSLWDSSSGSDAALTVAISVFPAIGLLILRRDPRNAVGWLLQAIGLAWGVMLGAAAYVRYEQLVDPGSLPAVEIVAALAEGVWVPAVGLVGTYLLLLFPDGALPSPRWRPVAVGSGIVQLVAYAAVTVEPGPLTTPVKLVNPFGVEAAESLLAGVLVGSVALLPMSIVVCASALVVRFRRSRGIERLQLKWLAAAGAVVAGLYLVTMATGGLGRLGVFGDPDRAAGSVWMRALETATLLSFVLIPAAIGVALLRYRLYDIDVVINRALVYGALTGLSAIVYLGSVLLLQLLLSPLTDASDLAVAVSTLAVAALFRPLRARIQGAVDRRFYRRRYDAALTTAAFVARLRHELEIEAVAADLREVVHETVQPRHVSVWLRGTPS